MSKTFVSRKHVSRKHVSRKYVSRKHASSANKSTANQYWNRILMLSHSNGSSMKKEKSEKSKKDGGRVSNRRRRDWRFGPLPTEACRISCDLAAKKHVSLTPAQPCHPPTTIQFNRTSSGHSSNVIRDKIGNKLQLGFGDLNRLRITYPTWSYD